MSDPGVTSYDEGSGRQCMCSASGPNLDCVARFRTGTQALSLRKGIEENYRQKSACRPKLGRTSRTVALMIIVT